MEAELALHLERRFPATRGLLYGMHTDPEQLARWWGPKGFSVLGIDLDLRVGGEYRIEMQPPEGDAFFLAGEFREVEPDARLAYTFRWEPPDPDDRETIVVLSFRDAGDGSSLTVDQGLFATVARRALHEQGWTESIDRLEELIKGREEKGSW